jgi:TatD DNase family protein
MELIDTHCHLYDLQFSSDREEVLNRAWAAGIKKLVVIGTAYDTSKAAYQLAQQDPSRIFHTIGIHPTDIEGWGSSDFCQLTDLIDATHPVAIGEIGLDYFHDSDPIQQRHVFIQMLQLAEQKNIPVVIHAREAHEDLYAILKEHQKLLQGILLHCYSSGPNWVELFSELGCVFSFGGPVTFKNGEQHREAVRRVPLNRIVLETDAPYLAPHPHRGKRNEPSFIQWTAQTVAHEKSMTLEELALITSKTARIFFKLPEGLNKKEIAS